MKTCLEVGIGTKKSDYVFVCIYRKRRKGTGWKQDEGGGIPLKISLNHIECRSSTLNTRVTHTLVIL